MDNLREHFQSEKTGTPLVFISNRALDENEKPAGGLGVALRFALEIYGGHWFCVESDGSSNDVYTESIKWKSADVTVHKIHIPKELYEPYYRYVNRTRWAPNHDRPDLAVLKEDEKAIHDIVARLIAKEIGKILNNPANQHLKNSQIFSEDFHFRPDELRQVMGEETIINAFLHTPLPKMTVRPRTAYEVFTSTLDTYRTTRSDALFPWYGVSKEYGKPLPVTPTDTLDWLEKNKPEVYKTYIEDFIESWTGYNTVGFQTAADARRFLEILGHHSDCEFKPFEKVAIEHKGKKLEVMHAPISIPTDRVLNLIQSRLGEDYSQLDTFGKSNREYMAMTSDGRNILDQINDDTEIVIYSGAERGDFSKGGPERLRQFYTYLCELPPAEAMKQAKRLQFIQICIPTRGFAEYVETSSEVEMLAHMINARFGSNGHKPVILQSEKIDNGDAILLGRAIRKANGIKRKAFCWIGALRDGKNLTVHEAVAAQDPDDPCLIVIPSKIGAAPDFAGGALFYDPEEDRAFEKVLKMGEEIYDNNSEVLKEMHGVSLNRIKNFDVKKWILGRLGQQPAKDLAPHVQQAPETGIASLEL